MVDEFPSNSHKDKEKISPTRSGGPKTSEKKVERVTTGEVVRRKKSRTSRLKGIFFGGDARGAVSYVALEVLIPAARDAIVDGATQVIERMIFGESRGGRRGNYRSSGGANYTPYNRYSQARGGGNYSSSREEPRREISARGRSRHEFDEIGLESRGEAEEVLDQLMDILRQYNVVTVADLYALVGSNSQYTDQKYGWTSLPGVSASRTRDGFYVLNLPKPEFLD